MLGSVCSGGLPGPLRAGGASRRGLEAQLLVEGAARFARVEEKGGVALAAGPIDHRFHEPSGEALAAVLRFGVHVHHEGSPWARAPRMGLVGEQRHPPPAITRPCSSRAKKPT